MKRLVVILAALISTSANANWERGRPSDDGARMTVSVRAGLAKPTAKMKNDLGSVVVDYWETPDAIYPNYSLCIGDPDNPADCTHWGNVDLGQDLSIAGKYDSISFAGGVSVGFVFGGSPNIRAEADWLRITESTFSADPLLKGVVAGNDGDAAMQYALSARATVSTDIISAMIYYDIFEGASKPMGVAVPYIGFGIGYASSSVKLDLTDTYYDTAGQLSFDIFRAGTVDFYASESTVNNFSASAALGVSYGIQEGIFFDVGARATYVPMITWAVNNLSDTDAETHKERAIFSAENVIFINVYAGLRFEF
ncbi:MAG: hypothetical protein LBQ49_02910 [Rickettsiales bacterium]|jgi:hypothetical protein|nr:hypothetical protein [Rickettsiales bacterium]